VTLSGSTAFGDLCA